LKNITVWLLFSFILTVSPSVVAETFQIAAIVAKGDHQSKSAREKICVYEGVVQHAKKRGLPVSIQFYDNERSPMQSEVVAYEIATTDANVVLGSLLSSEALPAAEVLERAHIPFVVNGTTPSLTNDRNHVVGLFANDYMQAAVLAEHAASLNPKRVIIIQNASNQYSTFLAKEFASQLLARVPEARVTAEAIFKNYPLFDRLAKTIVDDKPDVIFTPLYNPNIAQLYVALDKAKNKALVLGSDSVGGRKEFYEMIGSQSDLFNLQFVKNSSGNYSGEYDLFKKIHKDSCGPKGISPSYVGAAAFDIIYSVMRMVERDGIVPRNEVVESLTSETYKGLLGASEFQQDGTRKTLYLFEVGQGTNDFVSDL